jgi:hypothetical protein
LKRVWKDLDFRVIDVETSTFSSSSSNNNPVSWQICSLSLLYERGVVLFMLMSSQCSVCLPHYISTAIVNRLIIAAVFRQQKKKKKRGMYES